MNSQICNIDIKDYDENGNWKRDYMNMEIPFDELALPRNEEEEKLFYERGYLEVGGEEAYDEYAKIPTKQRDPELVESVLESFGSSKEEIEEILNELENSI